MNIQKQLLAEKTLPKSALERLAAYFQALSHPSRLHLLNCLCQSESGISVSKLAALTELSIANVSRHLALLAEHGMVKKEMQGNNAIYSLVDTNLHQICDLVCTNIGNKLTKDAQTNKLFLN